MAIERAIGQAILKRLATQGLGAWQMVQIVRAAGAGYRYQVMLADIREYTGRKKYEYQVRSMGGKAVIPESWMNKVEMNYPYKYKAWAEVEYYDPFTGKTMKDIRSVYTDDLLAKNEYEDFIEWSEIASQYYPHWNLTKVTFINLDVNTRVR